MAFPVVQRSIPFQQALVRDLETEAFFAINSCRMDTAAALAFKREMGTCRWLDYQCCTLVQRGLPKELSKCRARECLLGAEFFDGK